MTRLFIENKEIELDETVQFAITKQFEDLSNPTDIINDWSKTVSIPFTARNNEIFGHIYNPDKLTVEGGSNQALTGIYFNPYRKLDMRLQWGDDVLMVGYAKINEVKQTNGKGTYELTLFGELGKVFQEMQKITFDTTTDDTDYLIHGEEYVEEYINKDLVYNSWNSTGQTQSKLFPKLYIPTGTDTPIIHPEYNVTDIIGFAPNNSFSEGFDYNTFQYRTDDDKEGSNTFVNALETGFPGFPTFEEKTGIKPDTIIPNGISPRGIGEYRSYLQLPYIYWNKLFQMFQEKAEELTGYKFNLDSDWFNTNNPYWYNTVYMLKEFNAKDGGTSINTYNSTGSHTFADTIPPNTETTVNYPNYFEDGAFMSFYKFDNPSEARSGWMQTRNIKIDNEHLIKVEAVPVTEDNTTLRLTLSPNDRIITQRMHVKGTIEIYFGEAVQGTTSANIYNWKCYYFNPDAALCVNLKFAGANGNVKKQIGVIANINPTDAIKNFITTNEATAVYILKDPERSNKVGNIERHTGSIWTFELNFPETSLFHSEFGDYVDIEIEAFYHFGDTTTMPFSRQTVTVEGSAYTAPEWSNKYAFGTIIDFDSEMRITTDVFRSGSIFTMNDLWNNDYNIFNEILRYCKMYHINIEADDVNKEIIFKPLSKYFENYTVTDWTNKVDKSKDFIITPITFENKYILFNYDEGKTKIKEQYKDTYGVEYGEYRVVSDYNFNNDTKKLFNGQKSSNVLSPLILTWDTLYRNNEIIYRVPNENYIDNTDKENKSTEIFGQFYFHNGLQNFTTTNMPYVYLTDDSYLMKWNQTYFYLGGYGYEPDILKTVSTFPDLSLYNEDNMITYTVPKENYIVTALYTNKKGIFENFWENYLNERYNIQNKIITCYVMLTPTEYNQFKWNKFVKIDNQLCIVNKIYDYDITSNQPTKVDLVTIQDINGYISNNYVIS